MRNMGVPLVNHGKHSCFRQCSVNICDDFVKGCNERAKVCSALSTQYSLQSSLVHQGRLGIPIPTDQCAIHGTHMFRVQVALPGDASALSPGGVRVGAPAMTTRGCTQEDWNIFRVESIMKLQILRNIANMGESRESCAHLSALWWL